MWLSRTFKKLIYGEGVNPLPMKIVGTLFLAVFTDGMTIMTVFSYLPKLVKFFGVSEVETGKYAGYLGSALYLSRVFSSFGWGYITDVAGKKRAFIVALIGITISTCAFSFSQNFYWAFVCRMMQGLFMGVIVIAKSILGDFVDDTNQALGFSIIFSAYTIGALIGPSIGGALSFPTEQFPSTFGSGGFFSKFPIFIPNMVLTVGFIATVIISMYTLPKDQSNIEKFEIKEEGSEDIETSIDFVYCSLKLNVQENEKTNLVTGKNYNLFSRIRRTKWIQVFRFEGFCASVFLYLIYSCISIGYLEVFPVYAATDLKYKGLGWSPTDIALLLIMTQPPLIVIIWFVIPRLTNWLGPKKAIGWAITFMGISIALNPAVGLIKNRPLLWFTLAVVRLFTSICFQLAMLCINLFINNSVPSSFFGIANGVGMSLSSVGRAIGPFLLGSMFSWSLTNITSVPGQENKLGFPFDSFFTFLVIMLVAVLVTTFTYFAIPVELEKKKSTTTEESINTVTISYVSLHKQNDTL